jgi:hypothetical protein
MLVNLEQIQKGVMNYIEQEITPKATGFKKFGIYFMLPTIQKTVSDYVVKMKTFIPELYDENGNVKLDEFYSHAKGAIQRSGQFEFLGIIFNESDIDKLYSYIRNTSIA